MQEQNKSNWRKFLGETTDCSGRCGWSKRVRLAFYNEGFFQRGKKREGKKPKVKKWRDFVLNMSMTLAGLVLVFYFVPLLTFRFILGLNRGEVLGEMLAEEEIGETMGAASLLEFDLAQNSLGRKIAPRYDLTVKPGRWFRAEKAGVEAEILTNDDASKTREVDTLMTKGAYLYPDYSELGRWGRTVILAGHHFSLAVGRERSKKTFQNLDKIEVGDLVEVIDDYKIWTYEIYKVEKAAEISEKSADLIAYTCVYWWNSDLRLFVYGRYVTAQEVREASAAASEK